MGPIPKGLFIIGIVVMVIITVALVFTLFYLPAPNDNNERLFHFIMRSLKL